MSEAMAPKAKINTVEAGAARTGSQGRPPTYEANTVS